MIGICGVGAVTPFGVGIEAFWRGCLDGTPAFRRITRFATAGLTCEVAATAPHLSDRTPATALAVAATREAIADARYEPAGASRVGLYVASSHGESLDLQLVDEALAAPFPPRPDRTLTHDDWARVVDDRLALDITRQCGLDRAYRSTVSAACASGNVAFALAYDDLAAGVIDDALVVCADALAKMGHIGFERIGALAPDRVRPFARARNGTLMGEAAVAFVLSRLDRPRAKPPRAELLAVGLSVDCHHATHPDPTGEGIERATRTALASAGVGADAVDVVYLHGTGTLQNDRAEAVALGRILGDRAPRMCALKGLVGHCMGAAGGVGALAAILTLETGMIPAIPADDEPDPECPLPLVRGAPVVAADLHVAVSNAYGFGGINSSLLLRRGGA